LTGTILSARPDRAVDCPGRISDVNNLNPEIDAECRLIDYLELVELTGRCIREHKRGYIEAQVPALLQRLGICPENWLTLTTKFRQVFHGAVGHKEELQAFCQHQHLAKSRNLSVSEALFA
jgi:hypothetical protein